MVDWELSTVGDSLAELATALVYWIDPDEDLVPLGGAPTTAPGFLARDDLRALYEDLTGRETGDMATYLAFAHWRFAAILEGVYRRNLAGAYGPTSDQTWRRFETVVPRLADRALTTLEG